MSFRYTSQMSASTDGWHYISRPIAGRVRFFTLTQCFDCPVRPATKNSLWWRTWSKFRIFRIGAWRRGRSSFIESDRPASTRGAARDRHERGAGCGGRFGAFDEWRARRTAKSCGSDAPTLASSLRRQSRKRRWQKSPVTGKSAKETV